MLKTDALIATAAIRHDAPFIMMDIANLEPCVAQGLRLMSAPGKRVKGCRLNAAFTDTRQARRRKTQSRLPLLLQVNPDLDRGKLLIERLPCLYRLYLRKCAELPTPGA